MIEVSCHICGSCIKRFAKDIKRNVTGKFFCNKKCLLEYNKKLDYCQKIIQCHNCGKAVVKSASQIRKAKHGKNYCSSSCAAIANNKITQEFKKKKTKKCKNCPNLIFTHAIYCKTCWNQFGSIDNLTLFDVAGDRCMDATRYSPIRARCRRVYMQSERPKCCLKCGYEKHIEICHIKAISEFSLDSIISEINSRGNTVALCPNCHWEFDHGLISKQEIQQLNEQCSADE